MASHLPPPLNAGGGASLGDRAPRRGAACQERRTGTTGCPPVRSRELGVAIVRERPVRPALEPRAPGSRLLGGGQANVVVNELEHHAYPLALEQLVRGNGAGSRGCAVRKWRPGSPGGVPRVKGTSGPART